jgi:hypothetical protein
MGPIEKLLFGREPGNPGILAELFGQRDEQAADQARRTGEWCGSTPGHGIIPTPRLTVHVLGMS